MHLDRAVYDEMFDAGLALRDSARHAARYGDLLSRIPPDASSILDAGCGDGALLDRFPRRGRVVGIDFSLSALRRAPGLVACARIDALCFADRSFDLVLAGEVLEHLTTDALARSVREMARVARTYCIVSVPNRERLHFNLVTCPSCTSSVHAHAHLQSFDAGRLSNLIPGFEMREVVESGGVRYDFPSWAIQAGRLVRGQRLLPAGSRCPVCGTTRAGAFRMAADPAPRSRRILSFLATKRRRWLVATYVRSRALPFS